MPELEESRVSTAGDILGVSPAESLKWRSTRCWIVGTWTHKHASYACGLLFIPVSVSKCVGPSTYARLCSVQAAQSLVHSALACSKRDKTAFRKACSKNDLSALRTGSYRRTGTLGKSER
eukprot:1030844-Amphidinium_carterae.1